VTENGNPQLVQIGRVVGLSLDDAGGLYLGDQNNFRIRYISPDGSEITTVAGTGNEDTGGDDPNDLLNGFYREPLETNMTPWDLKINSFNELVYVEIEAKRIRKIFTCKNAELPETLDSYEVCPGDSITLEIEADLNDALQWKWFKDVCNEGEVVGTSKNLTVQSNTNVSYFVIGTGGCVNNETCAEFKIEINCLEYYNTFTPNDDGVNDFFEIPALINYPENKVVFYNRWGDVLETITNYDNSSVYWGGTNGNGDLLDSGTYFFVAEAGNEVITSGWIQLIKD
jgi:gliding motility-associated-like protein